MAARELRETNEEVTRIAGGVGPPVLDTVLHGRTRVTGAWTHRAYEMEVQPMQDHVICAVHAGMDNAIALFDGKRVIAPNRCGGVHIVARGHSGEWTSENTANVSNVFLGHERLQGTADLLAEGRTFELLDRVSSTDPRLYSIMKIIRDEVEAPGPHGVMFLEHALDLLCIVLLRGHSTLAYPFAQRHHGLAPWQVKRVTAYMRDRLGAEITLQELANIVNQSRFHFCTAFRTATGMAPYEYLTRLRMRTACTLLRSTPISIGDVGLAVGYSSLSAFSTAFRRYAGTSPRAYRNATH
jgi:AraC-like DNA-binding protein